MQLSWYISQPLLLICCHLNCSQLSNVCFNRLKISESLYQLIILKSCDDCFNLFFDSLSVYLIKAQCNQFVERIFVAMFSWSMIHVAHVISWSSSTEFFFTLDFSYTEIQSVLESMTLLILNRALCNLKVRLLFSNNQNIKMLSYDLVYQQ